MKSRQDLRKRTKAYALRIIKLYAALPNGPIAQVLGKQILRSGTSVGAHYREGCRAKSNADFVNKIEGALQELDETLYWLELIDEANVMKADRLSSLKEETEELIAMFVTMVKGVKEKTRMLKKKGVIPHPSALIPSEDHG
ncbi:MAG TPA: four helix bundle protein [Pyrinomonadaceae bacterium]|jgi:four helix bundle protein|nr:four helix bundle protein [Pyrinomonadaceae bacterium]